MEFLIRSNLTPIKREVALLLSDSKARESQRRGDGCSDVVFTLSE